MMSYVNPCVVSFRLDARGALASSQALGAIHSYPVGRTDPDAASTACKQRRNGIQLRVSDLLPLLLEPRRLAEKALTAVTLIATAFAQNDADRFQTGSDITAWFVARTEQQQAKPGASPSSRSQENY